MDAQTILVELQTLRSGEPEGALTRLRELSDAVEQVMLADRHSSAGIAAALTHQAIDYLCEGISVEQNRPDVARRNQPRSIAGSPWRSNEQRDGRWFPPRRAPMTHGSIETPAT